MTGKVNDFKENSEPECETKITFGLYGTFDNFKTFIIDTPGVGDPDNSDSDHLSKMIKYIKKNPKVSVIILVLIVLNPRFSLNERRILQLFYSMDPGTKIPHHLAIVWTRCIPSVLEQFHINIESRKKSFMILWKNIFQK